MLCFSQIVNKRTQKLQKYKALTQNLKKPQLCNKRLNINFGYHIFYSLSNVAIKYVHLTNEFFKQCHRKLECP